jgi:hypothetical protein
VRNLPSPRKPRTFHPRLSLQNNNNIVCEVINLCECTVFWAVRGEIFPSSRTRFDAFLGAECLKNVKMKICGQILLLRRFSPLENISPGFCREMPAEVKFAIIAGKPLWQRIQGPQGVYSP